MGSSAELQQEELEVLRSIYDGDECFKELSPTVFQYKIGTDGDAKSFLLEISWGDNYPDELPALNMATFYNKHLTTAAKSYVTETLAEQGTSLLGMAMTYTLFEYAKENCEQLFENMPQEEAKLPTTAVARDDKSDPLSNEPSGGGKQKEKKEQLTKSQKRKIIGRQDVNGEMPRGWNWVDVVKHLCQTGKGAEAGGLEGAAAASHGAT